MNSYGLAVLIAIMAAAGTLAVVPTFASTFSEQACPGCSNPDVYTKAQLAQNVGIPITVWTDSAVYDHESIIQVMGTVANIRGSADVTVTVYGPQNNLVTVRQVGVAEDKTYETSFSTAGGLFKQNGMYTIRVQYGPQEINNKVTVELVGETPGVEMPKCADNELSVKGGSKTYCVPYEITGATVTRATVSPATTSIVLMIDAESDGSISLEIPRNVLDARAGADGRSGQDETFFVLVDLEEADYEEIATDANTRTLDITFPAGATEIEIIGTFAVPEFGTMAAIILAVAIVSIIAVSARSRLSILPRY